MYPNEILFGIDLYVIFLCLGVVAAIVAYRMLADSLNIGARLQNLCLFDGVVSIAVGYYSAVLFQAFYNIQKYGELRIDTQTGATFYGGLIGGAACFILIYFVAGHFMFKASREHITHIRQVTDIGAAAVAIAHALGRIGCLMAGCCHGRETDAWYGIYMSALGKKVVPLQLYEAVALALLFLLLFYRTFKGKTYNLPLYMSVYGVWRFVLEYVRDDYRGTTFVPFLTPSQLTAVAMVLGAVLLFVLEYRAVKKNSELKRNER